MAQHGQEGEHGAHSGGESCTHDSHIQGKYKKVVPVIEVLTEQTSAAYRADLRRRNRQLDVFAAGSC